MLPTFSRTSVLFALQRIEEKTPVRTCAKSRVLSFVVCISLTAQLLHGPWADLAKAIAMSLKEAVPAATAQQAQRSPSTSDPNLDTAPKQLSAEEIRRRRLARFASADSA